MRHFNIITFGTRDISAFKEESKPLFGKKKGGRPQAVDCTLAAQLILQHINHHLDKKITGDVFHHICNAHE